MDFKGTDLISKVFCFSTPGVTLEIIFVGQWEDGSDVGPFDGKVPFVASPTVLKVNMLPTGTFNEKVPSLDTAMLACRSNKVGAVALVSKLLYQTFNDSTGFSWEKS